MLSGNQYGEPEGSKGHLQITYHRVLRLGKGECVLELELKEDAETLIEHGFDVEESHINCHPPHGKFINAKIMGLRSYIEDEDARNALCDYKGIKNEVIRLKCKADHELVGLQNGKNGGDSYTTIKNQLLLNVPSLDTQSQLLSTSLRKSKSTKYKLEFANLCITAFSCT